MLLRPARAALIAAFVLAGAAGAQDDETAGSTVTFGESFPLMTACYRAASDGATDLASLAACDKSLESEPLSNRRRAVVHANRGVVRFHIGDYEGAVADFTASLDLGINVRGRILANRGLSYEALRYDALARADYAAALAFDADNELARRRLEELKKPFIERGGLPRRITADAGLTPGAGV